MDLLKKGDFIGIVAPGSHAPIKIIKKGVSLLEQMGFKVKLGKHVFDITGHTAGNQIDRSSDINRFFADPEIKGIIAVRGGNNCNQILPYLDYESIRKNPKIFLGLSDVTVILNAITSKTKVTTFHGPVLLMIGGGKDGMAFSSYSQENFKRILTGKHKENIDLKNAFNDWIVLKKGKASGKLFGGNLSSLVNIIGTSYEPNWENKILIWETVGERIEMIDQMLSHFKLAKVFNKINGMIIGRLFETGLKENIRLGKKIMDVIVRQCKEYKFPIIYGVDFGHVNNNLILPIGGEVSFDTSSRVIKLIKY